MNCRIRSRRRTGFSLVELLAVVSIIALLISILVPSLAGARKAAKVASTRNTISVLESSLEMFKADQVFGGAYPESSVGAPQLPGLPTSVFDMSKGVMSPHTVMQTNIQMPICGASFLVWALAGADLLGTPGFRDLNGNGTWRDDTGNAPTGLYAVANNQPIYPRAGLFVSMEKMKCSQEVQTGRSGALGYRIEKYPQYSPGARTEILQYSRCFLDSFDRPILYYRANPAGTQLAGIQFPNGAPSGGIYDLYDNYLFTGLDGVGGLDLGRGSAHPMSVLGTIAGPGAVPSPKYSFAYAIRDPNMTTLSRPQRPDSYILLSPGPDGLWGTADDIGNIKENR